MYMNGVDELGESVTVTSVVQLGSLIQEQVDRSAPGNPITLWLPHQPSSGEGSYVAMVTVPVGKRCDD